MAKYIVDLDSLMDCLDFLSEGKINDNEYVYIQNVKAFIQRFPKEEYKENAVTYREYTNDVNRDILDGRGLKPLESCDHKWEPVGVYTAGTTYRCNKCYAHKDVPFVLGTDNITISAESV